MTTKKTRGEARGEADERSPEEMMIVPPDEAEELVRRIAANAGDEFTTDDATVGAFLLLIHSIVYTDSNIQREHYLHAAERVMMSCTTHFARASFDLRELALVAHRKGGAQ